ncbi:MAG: SOS response-associated peptidase family protein [Gracilimonas sp.]|uniref:SOS response-associated peptidase n=1 Tax=Gracilimonas TaxID=649462 RepID=UPI001AFF9929|nr:SOS response-associated peptidase family protein [Gracilimonas sp.]MBO6585194.1 SOS response-associated peptidase family protein [Gracilimonas sp.]MBO6615534.1 SOS response-associated peptidase family protein [Gracilimonas sp.]
MKRYVLEADKFIIEEAFGGQTDAESLFNPNYNVIPGNTMPIVVKDGDSRAVVSSVWGLKQEEADDDFFEIGQEEFAENKNLKQLAKTSPCIIPVSGFYKWKETVDDPLPFYLRVLTTEVTGLAGICTSFEQEDGRLIHSFAVITMPANALVEPLDDRMPVILEEKDYGRWLNGNAPEMLENGFSGNHLLPDMSVFRVPELVNDPSNNSKELVQPIPKLRNYDGPEDD